MNVKQTEKKHHLRQQFVVISEVPKYAQILRLFQTGKKERKRIFFFYCNILSTDNTLMQIIIIYIFIKYAVWLFVNRSSPSSLSQIPRTCVIRFLMFNFSFSLLNFTDFQFWALQTIVAYFFQCNSCFHLKKH